MVWGSSDAAMDSVDHPGDPHLRLEEGADTIHFRRDMENREDDNRPSRPISRLGFNRPASPASPPEPHDTSNSEAIQWSRSLFQNIGISDLRLSALKTHSEADTLGSAHSASGIGESGIAVLSRSENYFESPYGNAVEDTVKYAKVNRRSSSTSPPPVSRLCFPFVTTPSPRHNKSPPSLRPQRHKYSCFPSLMSPGSATYPPPSHQRHNYRHHGHSRLGLQNLKWFWSVREHEWNTCNTDFHNASTYGVSPDVHHDVIHTSNGASTPYFHSHRTLPMTIYPRRGDITALRDPYSFHIDRCFAGFASWTIGKILWMLDVHTAMEKQANIEDVSDEESECELETSASTGYSDDSDSTLVESENESDLLNLRNAMLDSMRIHDDEIAPQALSVGYLDNASWSRSVYTKVSKPNKSDCDKLPWATNWYDRWALLVNI